jgi:hypothetical protein
VKNTPADSVTTLPKPGPTAKHPYQAIDASDGENYKVEIIFGTHNGYAPEYEGKPLDVDGGKIIFLLNPNEKGLIYKVTLFLKSE